MFAPSVMLFGLFAIVVAEMNTSAAGPGTTTVAPPPTAVTQLLADVPLETAHCVGAPLRPPVQ